MNPRITPQDDDFDLGDDVHIAFLDMLQDALAYDAAQPAQLHLHGQGIFQPAAQQQPQQQPPQQQPPQQQLQRDRFRGGGRSPG